MLYIQHVYSAGQCGESCELPGHKIREEMQLQRRSLEKKLYILLVRASLLRFLIIATTIETETFLW
jgi:hypothetical protein